MNNSVYYFLFIHTKITQLTLGPWNSPTPTTFTDRTENKVSELCFCGRQLAECWLTDAIKRSSQMCKETSAYSAGLCPHLHFSVLLGADKIFLQLLQKTAGKYSMLFVNAS
ncbi:hypothetical protein I79_011648 [Cricetulus griseus]|uniref:Uncharacterized protein n=1 Tax=Cricetulus griseus TaxID=10029 RepID=G3HLQ6_CRIGR|nr:hypothetical protein I79_011648 [Cricetulus griseus]